MNLLSFSGNSGSNITNASLGGLAETRYGYLAAYNWSKSDNQNRTHDIYITYVPKNDFSTEGVSKWSSFSAIGQTPVIAPESPDGGYVLWYNPDPKDFGVHYVHYDSQGSISQIQTNKDMRLSDCQPVYYQGKVVWYVTDNSTPVFYALKGNSGSVVTGLAKGPEDKWYYYKNGSIDTSFTGLAENEQGWWYVEKGEVKFD